MKIPRFDRRSGLKSCFSYLISVFVLAWLGIVPAAGNGTGPAAQANEYSWRQGTNSVALLNRGKVVWQLNYDKAEGKPYFHPLSTVDGSVLSWLRPGDHPWHRALWFSWKLIDGLNYWEEDGNTGLSEGRTELTGVKVSASADFSARIEMTLSYHPPEKAEVLSEKRVVEVSAPQADGCYRIDWVSSFDTAASNVVLGRTPIPGQANGVEYGGYAGLSLRMAKETQGWTFVDSEGREGAAIHGKKSEWVNVSGNFAEGRGGVAIFSQGICRGFAGFTEINKEIAVIRKRRNESKQYDTTKPIKNLPELETPSIRLLSRSRGMAGVCCDLARQGGYRARRRRENKDLHACRKDHSARQGELAQTGIYGKPGTHQAGA
jgi:hypothetical protein